MKKPKLDPSASPFQLAIRPSRIHRWGVYALQDIPGRRRVIEYTGQRIGRTQAKERAKRRHVYLFHLDDRGYTFIDGGIGGSGAELINHSCEPNLRTVIRNRRIFYYALRPIRPSEELTVDYRFGRDMQRTACKCGAKRCRGTINVGG